MTIGSTWLDGLSLIGNARFVIQMPLKRKNITNGIEFAKASLKAMPNGAFDAFEIGNEVNLYDSIPEYLKDWDDYTDRLTKSVNLPKGPNFWALSISSESKSTWNVSQAFKDGLSKHTDKLKGVAQHYYQDRTNFDPQDTLLNHTDTVSKTNEKFAKAISFLKEPGNGNVPFIIGEVGSGFGGGKKHPVLEQSLLTAVWTVDWLLYTMSAGVSRVNMQQTTKATFSAWKPIDQKIGDTNHPAQVFGGWYGHVFVADVIGAAKKGKLQVTQSKVDGQKDEAGDVVAYSMYHDGNLAQIALLNEDYWTKNESYKRPSRDVTINDLHGVRKVKVQSLTGPSGDAMDNITWAGQSWSKASNGLPKGDVKSKDYDVKNNSVKISIASTEALLLTLEH